MTQRALIVTGGARGIGAAIVEAAAAEGWRVGALDRDAEALDARGAELRRLGHECLTVVCDVRNEREVSEAFAHVTSRLGPLGGLVTSAAIDRGGLVHELESSTWDEVMEVNLRGTFLCTREAVRAMLAQGGAIVCISSPFAVVAADATAAYGSSKAGVCALVRSLAVDYARQGVRINALLPGPTETELMWANVPRDEVAAMRATISDEVPLARLAEPSEIASAALWLLSDSASYVTGSQLVCDGGLLARAVVSA